MGQHSSDVITVTVNQAANVLPVANAGSSKYNYTSKQIVQLWMAAFPQMQMEVLLLILGHRFQVRVLPQSQTEIHLYVTVSDLLSRSVYI